MTSRITVLLLEYIINALVDETNPPFRITASPQNIPQYCGRIGHR